MTDKLKDTIKTSIDKWENNLKRRIYDTINVLFALKIFKKTNKLIEINEASDYLLLPENVQLSDSSEVKKMKKAIKRMKKQKKQLDVMIEKYKKHHEEKLETKDKDAQKAKLKFPLIVLIDADKKEFLRRMTILDKRRDKTEDKKKRENEILKEDKNGKKVGKLVDVGEEEVDETAVCKEGSKSVIVWPKPFMMKTEYYLMKLK